MGMWQTTLEANFKPIAQVAIKCRIYQGDTLSPLLLCIGLNPLSEILCKTSQGYQQQNGAIVNHLLCMDDVKLYARSEQDIESLIHNTRVYSNDISFGKERSGSQN